MKKALFSSLSLLLVLTMLLGAFAACTDGKDETFALTPFTKICIPPERALNQQPENPDQKPELPPPCSTAADLQKDDWVIVKTAATDTKTPVAGIIFVSKKTVEKK